MELVQLYDTCVTLSFVEDGVIFYIDAFFNKEVMVSDYWHYFDEGHERIQPKLHTDFKILHSEPGYIELYYKLKGKEKIVVVSRDFIVFEGSPDDYYGVPF